MKLVVSSNDNRKCAYIRYIHTHVRKYALPVNVKRRQNKKDKTMGKRDGSGQNNSHILAIRIFESVSKKPHSGLIMVWGDQEFIVYISGFHS